MNPLVSNHQRAALDDREISRRTRFEPRSDTQSTVSLGTSTAFVAPLTHPQHAHVLAGGGVISPGGPHCGADWPASGAATCCGHRRPPCRASRPIRSAKTIMGVCGPFGAPPARHPVCQSAALYAPNFCVGEGPSRTGRVRCVQRRGSRPRRRTRRWRPASSLLSLARPPRCNACCVCCLLPPASLLPRSAWCVFRERRGVFPWVMVVLVGARTIGYDG